MFSSASLTPEPKSSPSSSGRGELRKRCLIAATISYNKGLTTCECVIRNLSDGGARLDINCEVPLPQFFHLYIPTKNKRMYAQLKWQSETEAGIEFCDEKLESETMSEQQGQGEAGMRRHIRELEAEIVQLRSRIAQLTEGAI